MNTKRITLNLTSAEFEIMYRTLREAADENQRNPKPRLQSWPGYDEDMESLWEKVQLNYARNGCP